MHFVPVKNEEQPSVLALHRCRDLLMRQRTMILNAIRSHLAEFGIVSAQGPSKVVELVTRLRDGGLGIPELAQSALMALAAQLDEPCQARSEASNVNSWPGTGRTSPAGASRQSRASASSQRRHSPRACLIRASSGPPGSSQPGSASCRDRIRPAARRGLVRSRRWATAICADCSSSVRPR